MKASERETTDVVSALTGKVSALEVETGLADRLRWFSRISSGHQSRAMAKRCPAIFESVRE
jgi:hypothetical protein